MVSLERDHLELEIIGKKVLLSVTFGEPTKSWPISLVKSASYFFHRHFKYTKKAINTLNINKLNCFVAYQKVSAYQTAVKASLSSLQCISPMSQSMDETWRDHGHKKNSAIYQV
jgi:hypothetical protein